MQIHKAKNGVVFRVELSPDEAMKVVCLHHWDESKHNSISARREVNNLLLNEFTTEIVLDSGAKMVNSDGLHGYPLVVYGYSTYDVALVIR